MHWGIRCTAALAFAALTTPVRADSISHVLSFVDGVTAAFSAQQGGGPAGPATSTLASPLSFPAFEPALGNLMGWQIVLEANYDGRSAIDAARTQPGTVVASVSGSTRFAIEGDGVSILEFVVPAPTASCTALPGSCSDTQLFAGVLSGDSGIRTGPVPSFEEGVSPQAFLDGPADPLLITSAEVRARWFGTATLVYHYQPVPEPGSALLFTAGLAVLARRVTRRRA